MIEIIDSELRIHKRIVPKKWGWETIIHNDEDYCGKLLNFNKGAKFSMHFHIKKKETWYVAAGEFELIYIDTRDASEHKRMLGVGEIVTIGRGDPHQLIALTAGQIFEVSTPHYDDDSYRVRKGDSQNG